tara:strand:- start:69 stop:1736 length:1668 start_codon:yes stop_codon:yes gene_type:complete
MKNLQAFILFGGLLLLDSKAAAQDVPDYVPTDGLVAWYPFNGNAQDESGQGNNGLVNGAALTLDRFGNASSAYNFDGDNDWINCGSAPSISISTALTYSAWFRAETLTNYAGIVGRGKGTSCNQAISMIMLDLDNGLRFEISEETDCENLFTEPETFALSSWVHVVSVWHGPESDSSSVYVNGVFLTSAPTSVDGIVPWASSTENLLKIGNRDLGSGGWSKGYFDGQLDDIGVWSRALTADEILVLFLVNEDPVEGCMDATACNFNESANLDDVSCIYPPSGIDDCATGGQFCGDGTTWDAAAQACVSFSDCPFDINQNDLVDFTDFLAMLAVYGTNCSEPEVVELTCGDPVSYQGHEYPTVQIGDQCWFVDNLQSDAYRNGDVIPSNFDLDWASATSGAQAIYFNDSAGYLEDFGRLYNWYAVDDLRGLCPNGWHVASDSEWMTLEMTLGMSASQSNDTGWRGNNEGVQLKSSPADVPSWDGSNASGFSGLAGGYRYYDSAGTYYDGGSNGWFWSSTLEGVKAWARILGDDDDDVYRGDFFRRYGFSVRCLQDE